MSTARRSWRVGWESREIRCGNGCETAGGLCASRLRWAPVLIWAALWKWGDLEELRRLSRTWATREKFAELKMAKARPER